MDKYKYTQVPIGGGAYSPLMPITVDADNVIFEDNENLIVKLKAKANGQIYQENKITFSESILSGNDNEYYIIFGKDNEATSTSGSVIKGDNNILKGKSIIVIGNNNNISNNDNIINGQDNIVNGNNNIIISSNNTITGDNNTIIGDNNSNNGKDNIIIGKDNTVKTDNNIIIGDNVVIEYATGLFVISKAINQIHITDTNLLKVIINDSQIIQKMTVNKLEYTGKITAKIFDGKFTYDINNHIISRTYIENISYISGDKQGYQCYDGKGIELGDFIEFDFTYLEKDMVIYTGISEKITITNEEKGIFSLEIYNQETNDGFNKGILFIEMIVDAIPSEGKDKVILKYNTIKNTKSISSVGYPIKVVKEGKHIINLMYPIENLKDNTTYFIEVYLKCLNGQVTIDKNDIYCNIQGERLIKPVLNGGIPLPDDNDNPIG